MLLWIKLHRVTFFMLSATFPVALRSSSTEGQLWYEDTVAFLLLLYYNLHSHSSHLHFLVLLLSLPPPSQVSANLLSHPSYDIMASRPYFRRCPSDASISNETAATLQMKGWISVSAKWDKSRLSFLLLAPALIFFFFFFAKTWGILPLHLIPSLSPCAVGSLSTV